MPYKIAFISLGCAKNLVNTEQMMALTRAAGHTVTGDPEGADVAVLNTCGFIESAIMTKIRVHRKRYCKIFTYCKIISH